MFGRRATDSAVHASRFAPGAGCKHDDGFYWTPFGVLKRCRTRRQIVGDDGDVPQPAGFWNCLPEVYVLDVPDVHGDDLMYEHHNT